MAYIGLLFAFGLSGFSNYFEGVDTLLNTERMAAQLLGYDVKLDDTLAQKLDVYAGLLVDWNTRINLTAIKEPEDIEVKHMIDCLLLAAQPELQAPCSLPSTASNR